MAKNNKTSKTSSPSPPAAKSVDDMDIFELLGKSENIEQAAAAMQAMAHPLRIKILCVLNGGELMVQDILEAVGTTQSNVSQHLAILKSKNVITSRKEATKVFYRIDDARILRMITLTRDIFCGLGDDAATNENNH
jgi:DNA-binding transcriptional ArsR family regulator